MNISELEYKCKEEARKVFEDFKFTITNPPFITIKNIDAFIFDAVNSQVKQVYGTKIMSRYIDQVKSEKQMEYLQKTIDKYKTILVNTSYNYAKNHFSTTPSQ